MAKRGCKLGWVVRSFGTARTLVVKDCRWHGETFHNTKAQAVAVARRSNRPIVTENSAGKIVSLKGARGKRRK